MLSSCSLLASLPFNEDALLCDRGNPTGDTAMDAGAEFAIARRCKEIAPFHAITAFGAWRCRHAYVLTQRNPDLANFNLCSFNEASRTVELPDMEFAF